MSDFNQNNNATVNSQPIQLGSDISQTPTTSNSDWKPDDVPQLTVDVYKKGEVIYVVSTVAGVRGQDLDISVDGNVLTIKGQRRKPYNTVDSDLLVEECFWGDFYRELEIKENLNVDKIKADLKNGILVIEIPIIKVVTQKKINVNSI